MSIKKLLSTFLLITTITACSNNNINSPEELVQGDQVKANSWFWSNTGKVEDNGDPNIKMDNLLLSRRTFNNSTPHIYIDGAEAYPAMERLIDGAKKHLYVETFIFHDDASGRRIADKLVAKKKQGVDVKVLVDELGMISKKADPRVFDYFKAQGIEVKKYNRFVLSLTGINITHRKLLIADGDMAMTGGMNFGDEYAKEWHDSMTEVHGECVQDIQREFFVDWSRAGGKKPDDAPTLEEGKTYGTTPIRVAVTSTFESKKRYQIRDSLYTAIDYAKNEIKIEGAYFSDDKLIEKLVEAKKRGVNVEVILPKVPDNKIFLTLNLYSAKQMLKENINVFFYTPKFSHVKAAIIDNFVIVGSANHDSRSLTQNQELNIISEDPAFKQDMETRLFGNDLTISEKQTVDSVKVGFFKRIAQTALEILDYYL